MAKYIAFVRGGVILLLAALGCSKESPTTSISSRPEEKTIQKVEPDTPAQIPQVTADSSPSHSTAPTTESTKPTETPATPAPAVVKNDAAPPAITVSKSANLPLADKLAARVVPATVPTVIMSTGHQKLNLVKVADQFPSLTLMDVEGKSVSLSSLYGEKLTIVVFWNDGRVFAREQFDRMQKEIAARYGITGVNVVAVNVGDSAESVRKIVQESPKQFPCLLDPQGEAFKAVATDKLPRTYLLDKNGKVLWFDIEYSREMRRELDNAVHYFLHDTT